MYNLYKLPREPVVELRSLGRYLSWESPTSPTNESLRPTPTRPRELKLIRRQYYFILIRLNPRAPRRGPKIFSPIFIFFLFFHFVIFFPGVSRIGTLKRRHLEWLSLPRRVSPGRVPSHARPVVNARCMRIPSDEARDFRANCSPG